MLTTVLTVPSISDFCASVSPRPPSFSGRLQEEGRLDEKKALAGPVEEDEDEHAPDRLLREERLDRVDEGADDLGARPWAAGESSRRGATK